MTDSIDTNVVLRYILNDVPEQKKKVIDFLSSNDTIHYLSTQVISEMFFTLEKTYDLTRDRVANLISFFLARYDGIVEYDHNLTKIAIPTYISHPKLSWTDCALAAEAEIKHHEPLWTFDKKLASQLPQAKLME